MAARCAREFDHGNAIACIFVEVITGEGRERERESGRRKSTFVAKRKRRRRRRWRVAWRHSRPLSATRSPLPLTLIPSSRLLPSSPSCTRVHLIATPTETRIDTTHCSGNSPDFPALVFEFRPATLKIVLDARNRATG